MLNLFFWFYNQLSKLLDGKDSKILQSNAKKIIFHRKSATFADVID